MKTITVNNLISPIRIDQFLTKKLSMSRNQIEKLIKQKLITINHEIVTKNGLIIQQDDQIVINNSEKKDEKVILMPYDFKFDIVYEDNDLIIINKPKNILTHPHKFEDNKTIANALISYVKKKMDFLDMSRPGIIHRLDKNTTGLMVLAKNQKTLSYLQTQIKSGNFKRKYLALVNGIFTDTHVMVKAPLKRSSQNLLKMVVSDEPEAKLAKTEIWVKKQYRQKLALVECALHTGRTHQIRAHLAYLHHPVFNDSLYGHKQVEGNYEQFLHCHYLEFVHPSSKKKVIFEINLPDFFKNYLENLKE